MADPVLPTPTTGAIQQATFDWISTFWRNPRHGALQAYIQYSYLTRAPWYVAPGTPKNAHLSMVYVGVRYVLPTTSGTLVRCLARIREEACGVSGNGTPHVRWAVLLFVLRCANCVLAQSAPASPGRPWHSPAEVNVEADARNLANSMFPIDATETYSLPELIDLAETHHPATRASWEHARAQAAALGVTRSELFPTLAAAALSNTTRQEVLFSNRFYGQVIQDFQVSLDLSYTVFDFGARAGRIDAARARVLAANFAFNDSHRDVIYRVQQAYYRLLNSMGQEDAARASLSNAQAVQQAAQDRLAQGLATLPDVLEAQSASAQAEYDLQAVIGAEKIARGDLATAKSSYIRVWRPFLAVHYGWSCSAEVGDISMEAKDNTQLRRILGRCISVGILATAMVLGFGVLHHAGRYPRTEDAEVFANFIWIAPQVDGPLIRLNVKDNQFVKKGEPLYEIDEQPYQYALENALSEQAALEGQIADEQRKIAALVSAVSVAEANTHSAEAEILEAERGVAKARAEWTHANSNLHRLEPLLAKQFVTVDQVDRARTTETAQSAVPSSSTGRESHP